MHAIAAINFHRSFKHWRILSRIFISSWIDRWAARVLGAHTAWFVLKLSKELYKWFIFDVKSDWLFCELGLWKTQKSLLVRKRIILSLFLRRNRNADYAHRSKYDYSTCMHVIILSVLLSICNLKVSGRSLKLASTTQCFNTGEQL